MNYETNCFCDYDAIYSFIFVQFNKNKMSKQKFYDFKAENSKGEEIKMDSIKEK